MKQALHQKVGIVTPYHNEGVSVALNCANSLPNIPNLIHVVVCDGSEKNAGITEKLPNSLVLKLPQNVGDSGDTPRSIGAMYAIGLGCEAIHFLDVDNELSSSGADWLSDFVSFPEGLDFLVFAQEVQKLDGQQILKTGRNQEFWDTGQFLFASHMLEALAFWSFLPSSLCQIDDRCISKFLMTRKYKFEIVETVMQKYVMSKALNPVEVADAIEDAKRHDRFPRLGFGINVKGM